MTLAQRYRPRQLSEIVGQPHIVAILRAVVASESAPPPLLLHGVRGIGKTTSARAFAAALNCVEEEDDACGMCESCESVAAGTSSAVLELDAASNGGVADVHNLRDLCNYAVAQTWRVVVIDEAQSLSGAANNALLKLLEEPPESTVFMLVTTEAEKIFSTVRSRSLQLGFRALPAQVIATRLWEVARAEEADVEPSLCAELALRAGGHMRDALMLLEQCILAGVSKQGDFLTLYATANPTAKIIDLMTRGSADKALKEAVGYLDQYADLDTFVTLTADTLTDLLAITAGGEPRSEDHRALASRTDRAALYAAIKIVWEFCDLDVQRQPAMTQMRLLVARLSEVFDPSSR